MSSALRWLFIAAALCTPITVARAASFDWITDPDKAMVVASLLSKPVIAFFKGHGPVDQNMLNEEPLYDVSDDATMLLIGYNLPGEADSVSDTYEQYFHIKEFPTLLVLETTSGAGPARFKELFGCSRASANTLFGAGQADNRSAEPAGECAKEVIAFIKSRPAEKPAQ